MGSVSEKIFTAFEELRSRRVTLYQLIRYYFLKNYGFPDLLFQWPQVVWRTLSLLLKHSPFSVYSFSSFDLWLRSYYSKLAADFREAGRNGYVWDESLGFSMRPRFGSNLATYALYGALSPQMFSGISLALFVISVFLTGAYANHAALTLVIIFMLLISPTILFSLVGFGVKPEVVWWAFGVPMLYAVLVHQWAVAWIILGSLLLVNTSVSIILAMVLAPLLLWSVIMGQFLFSLDLLWLLPGVVVRFWRMWDAYRDGNITATVREQRVVRIQNTETKGRAWNLAILGQIFLTNLAPMITLMIVLLLAGWGHWISASILAIGLIGFNFLNWYGIKIADNVTIKLMLVSAVIALALSSGEWLSLISVFVVLYEKPFAVASYVSGRNRFERLNKDEENCHVVSEKTSFYRNLVGSYPWLSFHPFPRPEKLMQLFSLIQNGSRILMEGSEDPRKGSGFTRFHDWTYGFLPDRQVEFVNHTFLNRMLEPGLTDKFLGNFGSPALNAEAMHEVCCKLGVTYIIAISAETIEALQSLGYIPLAAVRHAEFAELADAFFMTPSDLTLLGNPEAVSLISPGVKWRRVHNTLTWEAKKGQVYKVKYRYHPRFIARQANIDLDVEPYAIFDDLSLRFMKVLAKSDGPLNLTYTTELW
jgi:hypothetical protein